MTEVSHIPEGIHSVTPYLVVSDAARAIEFYKAVFEATEVMRLDGPDSRIGHAELQIGDSRIMLADEYPDVGARSPEAFGGTPVSFVLFVEDVDAVFERAMAAGANELRPVKDQIYGDRSGTLEDPFGHKWTIATHKEDVSPEEMSRRMQI